MAYTYDDFIKRAQADGMLEQFSQDELLTAQKSPEYGLSMLSIKKELASASTPEQKMLATEAANQLKQAYGTASTAVQESKNGFVYSREDDYKKLFDSVTDPGGLQYDHEQDPVFTAMKKQQLREADRSMRDTLARVSASTGGVPSSYAVSAAQQARDYEVSKLTDAIPELYEAAYGRQQDALALLQEERENEYAQYLQEQQAALAARQQTTLGTQAGTVQGTEITESTRNIVDSLYPNGYVTDPDDWSYLVETYGADALAAAGYQQGVAAGLLTNVKARYPDGVVHNKQMYDQMVKDYGQAAVTAAGLRYEPDRAGFELANNNDSSGIYVNGYSGKLSWDELAALVQSGQVAAQYDDARETVYYYRVVNR